MHWQPMYEFSHLVKNPYFLVKHKILKLILDRFIPRLRVKGYGQYYIDLTDAWALIINDENAITYVLSDIKRQNYSSLFVFAEY